MLISKQNDTDKLNKQQRMQKKSPLTYLSPRLAILMVSLANRGELMQIEINLKARHLKYFHVFNLTLFDLGSVVSSTSFKWREIPFSITQTIKIVQCIDNYQSKNNANTAIIAVPDKKCFDFGLYILEVYAQLLGIQDKQFCKNQHAIMQFLKIYKTISIKNPPLKIIQAILFKNNYSLLIPIPKIFTQVRYNNFQQIYNHNIQQQLTKYYIQRKRPLRQGIGLKYCQKKPSTNHLSRPVIVCGDVKIQIYSYLTLNLQKQFVCGFNTKALQYDETLIQFNPQDFYQVTDEVRIQNIEGLVVMISDYCQKCKDEANCQFCLQAIKKINTRYNEAQNQLERLHRKRLPQNAYSIFY